MSGSDPSFLFIIGSGDDSDRIRQSGPSKVSVRGSSDLHKLLLDRVPYELLHVTRNYFRQSRDTRILHYRVLVNFITEPEQNSRTLDNLRKLLRGVPGRVINPPEAVLRSTRDKVARLLTGIPGLIVPRTARLHGSKAAIARRLLENAGISPPIILRQAGTHGGKILGCFDSLDAAGAAMTGSCEHVATQFVDFGSPDGLYRKYRVFFIGAHGVLRHILVSDSWNVHASARANLMAHRPELVAEERAFFEGRNSLPARVQEVLLEVRRKMPLDFFGMDFGVTSDGDVVLFEANATMSFLPFSTDPQFEYLARCFAPAQAAFRELLGLTPEAAQPMRYALQTA